MTLTDRTLINTILHECHDSVASGYLSENRILERVKNCPWWPNWRKDVAKSCHTCDRCQKDNRATGKKFGMMIQIQEPKYPWEIVHMDLVTALPPGGDRSYSEFLVLVDRYSKTPILLPSYKDYTAMDTAIMIWNKLLFSTAYQPQNHGLAERMIQTLEEMIRRFCSYGLEFKDSDGFNHDWCTLMPALELAYRISTHSSIGKTPVMSEKGLNPGFLYDTFKKDLVDIHPTARSLKKVLYKARHDANRFMQDSFKYAKERWDKSHKLPDFKVGDLVLVSTLNFNNIKVPDKLEDYFSGPFMTKALHGTNAAKLELTDELMKKHPTFPVSLISPYSSSEKELFPLRNKPPFEIPPLTVGEEKNCKGP
ncbi:hypothetical protein O181_095729 [Austropuccinia psidii MF-1]|uniref:Integrase catalytic domain-containing protein n=1 Tax=Austropuccinia psidii MF-1 TaxID=1389203 RepID=A0A9Q3J5W8_9BASI|nr:hypothetical protein [Austropuccinia psidii MF-1]